MTELQELGLRVVAQLTAVCPAKILHQTRLTSVALIEEFTRLELYDSVARPKYTQTCMQQ